jgi:hypothetical protein
MMRKNDTCKNLKFEDCELAILRQAVDTAEEKQGKIAANSPEVKRIIGIVENFIRQKQLICYGGTAINNILPRQDQFYNTDVEIPDYDFYSPNALTNAKELVDTYIKEGFVEVEAKSGQHHGTYKVFVNFIPVADITSLPKELFNAIKKEAIRVAGVYYAPPNLLRMSMYLELSRPEGDVSRWEKVLKRLTLLNRNYPLTAHQCSHIDFQRKLSTTETRTDVVLSENESESEGKGISQRDKTYSKNNFSSKSEQIYETVKSTLMDQGVVFFGGYAVSLYSQYMPKHLRKQLEKIPDFDVLAEDPLIVAQIVKERLQDINIKDVKIIKRPAVGEIIAPHYEIRVGKDVVSFIYEPIACHSYNVLKQQGYNIKVATIDTMLSFYLAFLYANRPYYDKDRILCMSKYLFEVQGKNRLQQKGLLKRFSASCMGRQETVEQMRAEKTTKFAELKDKKGTAEYDEWFLRYRPLDEEKDIKKRGNKKTVNRKKTIKKKTRKTKGFFGY